MNRTIKTNRLFLRPFEPGDLVYMSEFSADSENTRFLTSPNKSVDEVRKYLDWVVSEWSKGETQKYFCYAVVLGEKLIGEVALGVVPPLKKASIGWIIHKDHHNKGYATEAVRKIIEHAFKVLDIESVISSCDEKNTPSRRVMQKCGMLPLSKKEAWEYDDGRVSGAVYYCIERTDHETT